MLDLYFDLFVDHWLVCFQEIAIYIVVHCAAHLLANYSFCIPVATTINGQNERVWAIAPHDVLHL
jgi:hypothetical protein